MKIKFIVFSLVFVALFISCSNKNKNINQEGNDIPLLQAKQNNHKWYCFAEGAITQIDLPQHAPDILEKPWTEAVRISSCASLPQKEGNLYACALVNRLGLVLLTPDSATLYQDNAIFSDVTVDSLVFSNGTPIFYLYRSSFFNKNFIKGESTTILPSRPFLVEFNTSSNVFYPLVSYENLGLDDDEQIIGFFWDGTTWACTSKRITEDKVVFSYFYWEPLIPLTDLSPALSTVDLFSFHPSNENEYRNINIPRQINVAPDELKLLVSSIPSEMTLSISWKDTSGTSPRQYFQQGSRGKVALNANGAIVPRSNYASVIFADGTVYIKHIGQEERIAAFRLPLLPAGYLYGDFAIAGDTLYVAWEQSNFYKTGKSGFISVDLKAVLSQVL